RPTLLHEPSSDTTVDIDEQPTFLHDGEFRAVRPQRPSVVNRLSESQLWQSVKPRSRGALFFLLGLMLVSGIFGALTFAVLYEEKTGSKTETIAPTEPAPTHQAPLAELDLSTMPPGAQIKIGGQSTGSMTPAVLDLPPEMTTLELVKEGYRSKTLIVELSPGKRKVMHLDLEAADISAMIRLEPPITAVLDFPELHKRYLARDGELIAVDGLRVGEEVRVVVRPDNGGPIERRFVPHIDDADEIVLNLAD